MKFSCDTKEFSNAIKTVSRAVSHNNSAHPILTNIRIQTYRDDWIILTGCDLSRQIQITINAVVDEEGDIALNAYLLSEIAAKLKSEQLVLSTTDTNRQALITAGKGKYKLVYLICTDYPNLDESVLHEPVLIPADVLLAGLKRTIFAVCTDDAKGNICGVSMAVIDRKISFSSTDGHRLAVSDITTDSDIPDIELILPTKSLLDLEKILPSSKSNNLDIAVHIYNNLVTFAWGNIWGNIQITTRTLNGPYPKVASLIPAIYSRNVLVDRQLLLDAIDLVRVMADDNNTINVSIDPDNQQLVLAGQTSVSSAVDLVPASITGDYLDISFNLKYLADSISNIATDNIQIALNGALQPVTITPVGDPIKSIYLVMPVQVQQNR